MKQEIKFTKLLILLVCILASCLSAQADVTIYVYGTTTAPVIKNGNDYISLDETSTTATQSFHWYTTTLNSSSTTIHFTTSTSDNNRSLDFTANTGNHYYYYDGNGFCIDLTASKDANQFCFYEVTESWWYNDNAQTVIDVYKNGGNIANKELMSSAGGTYNGNNVLIWASNTAETPTGVTIYRQTGSNYYNNTLFNYYSKGIFYKGTENNMGNFSKPVTNLTWPEENINTGKLYIVGQANGNPWEANVGIEMTATDNNNMVFKAENVLLVPGNNGFAFATMLGTTESDWTTLNSHRYGSNASYGNTWVINDNLLGEWQNNLQVDTEEKNFLIQNAGYYNIEVNLNTMQTKVTRSYNALYMYYGHSGSATWQPNGGVSMMTNDGETYTLSNIELKAEDTFQFTKQLSSDTSWPSDKSHRIGSKDGPRELASNDLNKVLSDALKHCAANEEPKDFKMGANTDGTYRVVVNLTDMSVALYNMATMLSGKVIIHLEQTSNVTTPKIWAYDKEAKPNGDTIHVDRPSRTEIATARKALLEGVEPDPAKDITTADGRQWWTWEVNDAMTDFWFTRGNYVYNKSDDTNADMTDIQWRKAGEIFVTWPATGTTLVDYTRDYYAAAAQEAADCAVMIEGHYYAYFTNTPGWDNVFCHAWYTDSEGTNHDLLTPPSPYSGDPVYPGALCEFVGYDKDGYEVWRIDLTAHGVTEETMPVGIIFSNGVFQETDYYTGETATYAAAQTSDFVYSTGTCYDYCGVIVLGRSLGNIIRNGVVDGPVYTIEEELVGVYVDESAKTIIEVKDGEPKTVYGALYCKDLNNFVSTNYVEKSLQQEGEIDYVIGLTNLMGDKTRYDQSNWVKLTLSTQYPDLPDSEEGQLAILRKYKGKLLPAKSVQAQLVDNHNPEMRLALQALPIDCSDYRYDENVFVTSNFIGSQDSGIDGSNKRYFFVTPKPQEFATITWAVYGGNNQFFVPTQHSYTTESGVFSWMNEANLNGYFPVQWDLQEKPDLEDANTANPPVNAYENLPTGQAYKFHAIIRLAEDNTTGSNANAPQRVPSQPYKNDVTTSKYIVSPIDLNIDESHIVTAVTRTDAARTVKSVRYYNMVGMAKDTPFDGVNIIVTDYSDGSQQTSKAIY